MDDGFAPPSLKLPPDLKQGPVCGVLAVAVAAGVSFSTSWSLIKSRKRGGWRGRTTHSDRVLALTKLGVRFEYNELRQGCRTNLSTFVKLMCKPGVTYIVRTGGHIQVVLDGWVLDQSGVRPSYRFWGRNKIATSFITITST